MTLLSSGLLPSRIVFFFAHWPVHFCLYRPVFLCCCSVLLFGSLFVSFLGFVVCRAVGYFILFFPLSFSFFFGIYFCAVSVFQRCVVQCGCAAFTYLFPVLQPAISPACQMNVDLH